MGVKQDRIKKIERSGDARKVVGQEFWRALDYTVKLAETYGIGFDYRVYHQSIPGEATDA